MVRAARPLSYELVGGVAALRPRARQLFTPGYLLIQIDRSRNRRNVSFRAVTECPRDGLVIASHATLTSDGSSVEIDVLGERVPVKGLQAIGNIIGSRVSALVRFAAGRGYLELISFSGFEESDLSLIHELATSDNGVHQAVAAIVYDRVTTRMVAEHRALRLPLPNAGYYQDLDGSYIPPSAKDASYVLKVHVALNGGVARPQVTILSRSQAIPGLRRSRLPADHPILTGRYTCLYIKGRGLVYWKRGDMTELERSLLKKALAGDEDALIRVRALCYDRTMTSLIPAQVAAGVALVRAGYTQDINGRHLERPQLGEPAVQVRAGLFSAGGNTVRAKVRGKWVVIQGLKLFDGLLARTVNVVVDGANKLLVWGFESFGTAEHTLIRKAAAGDVEARNELAIIGYDRAARAFLEHRAAQEDEAARADYLRGLDGRYLPPALATGPVVREDVRLNSHGGTSVIVSHGANNVYIPSLRPIGNITNRRASVVLDAEGNLVYWKLGRFGETDWRLIRRIFGEEEAVSTAARREADRHNYDLAIKTNIAAAARAGETYDKSGLFVDLEGTFIQPSSFQDGPLVRLDFSPHEIKGGHGYIGAWIISRGITIRGLRAVGDILSRRLSVAVDQQGRLVYWKFGDVSPEDLAEIKMIFDGGSERIAEAQLACYDRAARLVVAAREAAGERNCSRGYLMGIDGCYVPGERINGITLVSGLALALEGESLTPLVRALNARFTLEGLRDAGDLLQQSVSIAVAEDGTLLYWKFGAFDEADRIRIGDILQGDAEVRRAARLDRYDYAARRVVAARAHRREALPERDLLMDLDGRYIPPDMVGDCFLILDRTVRAVSATSQARIYAVGREIVIDGLRGAPVVPGAGISLALDGEGNVVYWKFGSFDVADRARVREIVEGGVEARQAAALERYDFAARFSILTQRLAGNPAAAYGYVMNLDGQYVPVDQATGVILHADCPLYLKRGIKHEHVYVRTLVRGDRYIAGLEDFGNILKRRVSVAVTELGEILYWKFGEFDARDRELIKGIISGGPDARREARIDRYDYAARHVIFQRRLVGSLVPSFGYMKALVDGRYLPKELANGPMIREGMLEQGEQYVRLNHEGRIIYLRGLSGYPGLAFQKVRKVSIAFDADGKDLYWNFGTFSAEELADITAAVNGDKRVRRELAITCYDRGVRTSIAALEEQGEAYLLPEHRDMQGRYLPFGVSLPLTVVKENAPVYKKGSNVVTTVRRRAVVLRGLKLVQGILNRRVSVVVNKNRELLFWKWGRLDDQDFTRLGHRIRSLPLRREMQIEGFDRAVRASLAAVAENGGTVGRAAYYRNLSGQYIPIDWASGPIVREGLKPQVYNRLLKVKYSNQYVTVPGLRAVGAFAEHPPLISAVFTPDGEIVFFRFGAFTEADFAYGREVCERGEAGMQAAREASERYGQRVRYDEIERIRRQRTGRARHYRLPNGRYTVVKDGSFIIREDSTLRVGAKRGVYAQILKRKVPIAGLRALDGMVGRQATIFVDANQQLVLWSFERFTDAEWELIHRVVSGDAEARRAAEAISYDRAVRATLQRAEELGIEWRERRGLYQDPVTYRYIPSPPDLGFYIRTRSGVSRIKGDLYLSVQKKRHIISGLRDVGDIGDRMVSALLRRLPDGSERLLYWTFGPITSVDHDYIEGYIRGWPSVKKRARRKVRNQARIAVSLERQRVARLPEDGVAFVPVLDATRAVQLQAFGPEFRTADTDTNFMQPLAAYEIPASMHGWPVIPQESDRKRKGLLWREMFDFCRAWQAGELTLNPDRPAAVLLETSGSYAGQDYRRYFPLDFRGLLTPEWLAQRSTEELWMLRSAIAMDTALRVDAIAGFEGRKLMNFSRRGTLAVIATIMDIEGKCPTIKATRSAVLSLHTFLWHATEQGFMDELTGNTNQVRVAQAAGFSHLYPMSYALRYLRGPAGTRWKDELGYLFVRLSVGQVQGFFEEMMAFKEETGVPMLKLDTELRRAPDQAARFREIQQRYADIVAVIGRVRQEYWPQRFATRLAGELSITASTFDAVAFAQRVVNFIAENETRILHLRHQHGFLEDEMLADEFGAEMAPYVSLFVAELNCVAITGGRKERLHYGAPDRDDSREAHDRIGAQRLADPHPHGALVQQQVLDPQAELIAREEKRMATTSIPLALESLGPTARQVIQQVYFEGRDAEEVAEDIGMSVEDVQAHEAQALAKMHMALTAN